MISDIPRIPWAPPSGVIIVSGISGGRM